MFKWESLPKCRAILPHLFEIVGRYPSHKPFLTRGRSEASFLLILLHMGKELNFLPLKYKAMGKESKFLFSLNAQLSPTWGRSRSPESKLSFSTNSSPKCKAILPHNFTNPSHSICREGFVPIMQNLYKSFTTNESFYFFFSSFFILCLFHFILFIFSFSFLFFFFFFFFFFLFLLRVFFFFQNLKFFPKGENLFPSIWGDNRRIDAPVG